MLQTTRRRRLWLSSVLIAVFPFLLLCISLEIFSTPLLPDMLSKQAWSQVFDQLQLDPNSVVSLSLFQFTIMNFVHVIICLMASIYCISKIMTLPRSVSKLVFSAAFSFAVIFAVIFQAAGSSAFSALMVEPVYIYFASIDSFAPPLLAQSPRQFVLLLLVFPTSLGIIAVILSTVSFHSNLYETIGSQESNEKEEWIALQYFNADIMVLSCVLVSSSLTAHMFFNLPLSVMSIYSGDLVPTLVSWSEQFARALSLGSSILFTITMIAVFAPGLFAMSSKLAGGDSQFLSDRAPVLNVTVLTRLKDSLTSMKRFWSSVTALLAPVLAPPLFEFMNSLLTA
ncbi:MAG: hypothetical protein AAFP97_05640 [Pseudomonadota bacterium]